MGFNKLSECKIFNEYDKRYNYSKLMTEIDFTKYAIPTDMYMGRIDVFKGYKLPFARKIYDYLKEGKIIPVMLSESTLDNKKLYPNLHLEKKFPKSIFNLITFIDGDYKVLVDLSYKGTYSKNKQGEVFYLDIPDIDFYYMCLAGYLNLKMVEDDSVTNKPEFYQPIAEEYSLFFSKIIDNYFPTSSSTDDYDKLFFLCNVFCLQSMFNIPKDVAVIKSSKMRVIHDKKGLYGNCKYVLTDKDIMNNVDYKTVFPIDNFIQILIDEFPYFNNEKFNFTKLVLSWANRFGPSSQFTIEHLNSFINMIVFSKASMGIYNDVIIRRYLELQSNGNILELFEKIIK